MPKYSIITPNYNGFSLMAKYFHSMEQQTFKDFELIIVDDCSTDDSYSKLLKYSKKSDLDIKVFQAESNSGPGNARNIGMDHASGEFITFVDNDDWVENTLLEEINKVCESNPLVNCVIYDYFIKTETGQSVARSMYKGETGLCTMPDCMLYARNHSVGKFYRLAKCGDVRFPALRRCEDVAFACRAIEACQPAYYLKKPLYYYYQRSASLSNNSTMDESDMVRAFGILENALGDKYPNELKEKSITDLLYGGVLMMAKSGKSSKEIKSYIYRYEKKYPEWWKCNIVNEIGKAKKIFLMCVKRKNVVGIKIIAKAHEGSVQIITRLSKSKQ